MSDHTVRRSIRPAVRANREAILTAATGAMHAARARRTRSARIAAACAFVAIAALGAFVVVRERSSVEMARTLAIDFAAVKESPRLIDFASITRTDADPRLDFQSVASNAGPRLDWLVISDDEAERTLAETGYCVKIVRMRDEVHLVDCSTGQLATIQ
jgi:hypothetical protein